MAQTTAKISITVDRKALGWAKRRAKRAGVSLSTVISDAIRREQQSETRERLLERLGAPELNDAELEEIRKEWRG